MMRILARILAVLCLVLTTASCVATPSQTQPQPEVSVVTVPPVITPHKTSAPNPTFDYQIVATPWRSGDFEKGIQIFWHYPASDVDTRHKAGFLLDYAVNLGANSIAISFPVYTDGIKPTRVYTGTETPTPEQLGLVIDEAKKRHLRVMIRPIIDETNIVAQDPIGWRGSIRVADTAAWFASYDAVIGSYVPMAVSHGVDEFVAGTELVSLQKQTAQWRALIQQMQSQGFTGKISYAGNWSGGLVDAFPALGTDAYPAIQLGDSATVEQLTGAISDWMIKTYTADERSRMTVQEAGIPAISGMYVHPWFWGTNANPTLNFTVQANWFAAMYQATRVAGMQGIYYWTLDTNLYAPVANPQTDYPGSFYGRPAADAIRQQFNNS